MNVLRRFFSSIFGFISSLFTSPPPPLPEDDLPPAKVAIIGAGMGGCFAAKFLRENGGKKLEIHVFAKKGSKIGGRSGVCQVDGHIYEAGASVIHADNKYLSDAAKEHDLGRKGEDDPTVPFGLYDGKSMFFRTGVYGFINSLHVLWRYGFDLFKMNSKIKANLKKFANIYTLQANGKMFKDVDEMLTAMGGEEMSRLVKVSAREYLLSEENWNEKLVHEVVTAALRVNYGQTTSVNAFTTLVSLAGMQDGKLWSVIGGNYKIAESVLKASAYTSLIMEDVISVTKSKGTKSAKYTITTQDEKSYEDFDIVIVANPLNLSSIKYENFGGDVYSLSGAKTPYHRTVATMCHGKINQTFFGERADLNNFPQTIITTGDESLPFKFNSVAVEIPSEIAQSDVPKYTKPLQRDPVRVWKVFSPEPLSQDELLQMFSELNLRTVQEYNWLAYPEYHPPEQVPPFVLDDGVFYVNAIEKAASAMEMSAIGAKNAALLARDYLLKSQ